MHQRRSEWHGSGTNSTDSLSQAEGCSKIYDSIDPRALFLASPDAIAICDTSGHIVLVNEQLCHMFGYREQQLIGQPIEILVPHRLRADHVGQRTAYAHDPSVRLMGQCREVSGLRSDGREISLEIRLRQIESLQGSLAIAAIRDITEMRSLGAVFRQSNRILQLIATGRGTPEVLSELLASIENWTAGARCAILRRDPSQQRFQTLQASLLPSAFCEAIDGLALEECSGPCGPAAYRGERQIIHDILCHPECNAYRALTQEHQLRAVWSEPIRDTGGAVLGSFAVYYDEPHLPEKLELEFVSAAAQLAGVAIARDLRNEELLQKEEQLRQAQKLDAVGTLAGGIAHEFNNLLQVILGYTNCVIGELREDDPWLEELQFVRTAGEQARDLTSQILSFGQRRPMKQSLVEINAVVRQACGLLRPLLGSRIQLDVKYDECVSPILADAGQLLQVLVNLGLNARDSIVGIGRIAIGSQTVLLEENIATSLGRNMCESAVRVSLSDSGCGMSPEVCAKVFDPFFTTKPIGQGTGLGLSVVHGIIRDHQGVIKVESEPGSGTTFHLYFPIADESDSTGHREGLARTPTNHPDGRKPNEPKQFGDTGECQHSRH